MATRANRLWLCMLLLVPLACTEDAGVVTPDDTSGFEFPEFDFGPTDGSDGSDENDGSDGSDGSDSVEPDAGPTDEVIDPDIIDPDSPCIPNPCTTPPPLCDGETLQLHTIPGNCIEPEAESELTGPPECEYTLSSTTDCGALGKRCSDTLAICVDCLEDADCGDDERCDPGTHACLPLCTGDPFEENDSLETAAAIAVPATVTGLHVCDSDSDFYAVPLPLGGDLYVTVSPGSGGELDVGLLRTDGSVVVTATANAGSYEIAVQDLPAGGYVVAVASSALGIVVDYSLALTTLEDDPCVPNPCTSPPPTTCDGQGIVTYAPAGQCTLTEGGHECAYAAALPVDCAPGYCLSGACTPYRQPAVGELIVSEAMIAPHGTTPADGQWFEVRNVGAESLTLQGVTVTLTGSPSTPGGDAVTSFVQASPLYVAPGGVLLFGRNVDPKANGGVTVDRVYDGALLNTESSITLSLAESVLDAAAWDASYPHVPGRSLMLSPALSTAESNDLAASWCASALSYGPGGAGSPGKKNDPCPYVIERCRITAPTSATLPKGASFTVSSEVRAPGLTDASAQLDLHPLLRSEAGYGPVGTTPSSWTSWAPQKGSAGLNDTEDVYGATLTAPIGSHDVAARFSGDAGTTWTYCDRDVGPGQDGSEDGYAAENAGKVTVLPDPCDPNPCVTPPDACEAGLLRIYPLDSGSCILVSEQVQCAYAPTLTEDCGAAGKICDPVGLACRGCSNDTECGAPLGTCGPDGACTSLCLDDDAEPDDTADTSPLVAPPFEADHVLCSGDDDFRRIAVAPGDLVTVSAERLQGDPFVVEVLDAQGAGVVGFIVDATAETKELSVPETAIPGVWVVSVRGLLPASKSVYAIQIDVTDDPCVPNPCSAARTECDGDEQVVYANDLCTRVGTSTECTGPESDRIACPDHCNDGQCTAWRRPGAGELLITEVATEERGNFVEVLNFTDDLLNLDGAMLEGPGGPMALVTGMTLVPAGSRIVFTDSTSAALITGDTVVSPELSVPLVGTLRLTAFGLLLDQATVDGSTSPGAVGLDPSVPPSSNGNDVPTAFCSQRTVWPGGVGTPNAENDACALAVTFCRTQFPDLVSVYPGDPATIYARWYNASLTPQSTATDLDPEERVRAELGLAPVGSDEGAVVTWTPMEPNALYDGASSPVPEPNNDEWVGVLTAPVTAGEYAVIVRFSGDEGVSWTSCDLGLGSSDGWSANSTTRLTVNSCPNDLLEPSNPTIPRAWPTSQSGDPTSATLTVCGDDTDALQFVLGAGESAGIGATAIAGSGTIAVRRDGILERVLPLEAPGAGAYIANAAGIYVVSFEHDTGVATVALTLTVTDACDASPCPAKGPSCAAGVLEVYGEPTCDASGGTAVCDYETTSTTCPDGCAPSGTECLVTTPAAVARPIITEFYIAGSTVGAPPEFVEIHNHTDDLVSLNGATLWSGPRSTPLDGLVIPPNGYVVVGEGPADLTWPPDFELTPGALLSLEVGSTTLVEHDTLAMPSGGLYSVSLDALKLPASWAQTPPDAWCHGEPSSPGIQNPTCPVMVGWCRLQFPTEETLSPGTSTPAYGRIWVAGVTSMTPGVDVHPRLWVELGIGPTGSQPTDASWSWVPSHPTPGWNGPAAFPFPEPNNDEYVASLVAPSQSGLYQFAFRVSGNSGTSWLYCDQSRGFGADGAENGYSPADGGLLTVP